jgi:hypothetical protein
MTGPQHPLVLDYRAQVESAVRGLPPSIRAELVSDLSAHLDNSLSPSPTDADVEAALKELGDPDDVVAAAYEGLGAPSPTLPVASPLASQAATRAGAWGPVEVIAVGALTLGAFVLPFVGPVVGLAMAWVSARWSRREKLVATLLCLAPGLLLVPIVATATLFYSSHLFVLGLLAFLGPVIAAVYLSVRLTSRRDR